MKSVQIQLVYDKVIRRDSHTLCALVTLVKKLKIYLYFHIS